MPPILALLAFVSATDQEPVVWSTSNQRPLALLLITPTGEAGRVSRSEAIRAVETALDSRTELYPLVVDPSLNRDCRGRMACIIERWHRDAPSNPDPIRWMLVLTQITLEGEADRVSATLVDLGRAQSIVAQTSETEAEVQLDQASVRTAAKQVVAASELTRYLVEGLDGPFRDSLARADDLRAAGKIRLAPTRPGSLVHLDGRALGAVGQGWTIVERISPGVHTIRVTGPNALPWKTEFELKPAEVRTLAPQLRDLPKDSPFVRPTFVVAGSVTAVAGATLIILAAASADSDVKTACFSSSPGCESGQGFIGFDYDSGATTPSRVDPDGVGIAPLGSALAIAGLGLAVGALLEDGEDVPWWTVAISLVAGGAAFGLATVLDQGQLP